MSSSSTPSRPSYQVLLPICLPHSLLFVNEIYATSNITMQTYMINNASELTATFLKSLLAMSASFLRNSSDLFDETSRTLNHPLKGLNHSFVPILASSRFSYTFNKNNTLRALLFCTMFDICSPVSYLALREKSHGKDIPRFGVS